MAHKALLTGQEKVALPRTTRHALWHIERARAGLESGGANFHGEGVPHRLQHDFEQALLAADDLMLKLREINEATENLVAQQGEVDG